MSEASRTPQEEGKLVGHIGPRGKERESDTPQKTQAGNLDALKLREVILKRAIAKNPNLSEQARNMLYEELGKIRQKIRDITGEKPETSKMLAEFEKRRATSQEQVARAKQRLAEVERELSEPLEVTDALKEKKVNLEREIRGMGAFTRLFIGRKLRKELKTLTEEELADEEKHKANTFKRLELRKEKGELLEEIAAREASAQELSQKIALLAPEEEPEPEPEPEAETLPIPEPPEEMPLPQPAPPVIEEQVAETTPPEEEVPEESTPEIPPAVPPAVPEKEKPQERAGLRQDIEMLNKYIQKGKGIISLEESDFASEYGRKRFRELREFKGERGVFNKNELEKIAEEIERLLTAA